MFGPHHGTTVEPTTPVELHVRLRQIVAGRRGFLSIARAIKTCGMSRAEVKAAAEALGLVCANHGKYGLCASRPL